jgi:hypothetical protein
VIALALALGPGAPNSTQHDHNADFTVGADLSVTDTRTSRTTAQLAARQAQAQAQVFAADIRSRAGALIGADNEIAGNLTATAAGIGNTVLKPQGS